MSYEVRFCAMQQDFGCFQKSLRKAFIINDLGSAAAAAKSLILNR